MNYKYFIQTYIAPHVKTNDKPFNRQLFNDTLDCLHKDGIITDYQVNNWIYPLRIIKAKF